MSGSDVKIRISAEGAPQTAQALTGVEERLDRLTGAAKKAGHYGAALGVTFGLGLPQLMGRFAGEAVRAADAMTDMGTRLALVSGSAIEAARVQGQLFDIAQQSRVSFVELSGTYAQVARAGADLGISQQRMLGVTQAIAQAMTIGGGSAEGMRAALVQLSQGLASGVLRGEELNSVMEQAPRLARALADGLGVPIGKLREMGAAGELTARQVIEALEKAGPGLASEIGKSTMTMSSAMQVLSNSATRFIGDLDKASSASATTASAIAGVAGGIDALGKAIRDNETAVSVLLGAGAGVAAVAGLGGIVRMLASIASGIGGVGIALAANPAVLALLGVGAAAGVAVSGVSAWRESAAGLRSRIKSLEADNAEAEQRIATLMSEGNAHGVGIVRGQIADRQTQMKALREALALAEGGLGSGYAAQEAARLSGEANKGPFPGAKSIEETAKFVKLDIDLKRQWSNEAVAIAESYNQQIAMKGDPGGRLAAERDQRLIAGAKKLDRDLAALLPKVPKESRAVRDPLAERIALMQSAYGASPDTAQEDFRRSELGDQAGVDRALQAAREADQAKADSAIDAARKAAEGIAAANRAGNIALIEDDRARVAAQVELEREHMLAMIEPLRAMPEEYASALAGVNAAAELKARELSRSLKDEASAFTEQAARNIQDALGATVEATLSGNFRSIGKLWLDMLNRMVAQAIAADLGRALMGDYGKTGKIGGGLGSLIQLGVGLVGAISGSAAASTPTGFNADGSAFNNISAWVPPGRASGGPVAAGATYMVGERGPELLRMGGMGGSVIPNRALLAAGGGDVKVNVINNAGAAVGVGRGSNGEIEIMLERAAEQGAQRGYSRAVADVASGTGRLSSALSGRGVNLGNAALRRA